MVKTVFAYMLPNAVQIWTYVRKENEPYQIGPQFKIIRNFVNQQRYQEALLEGNVAMGFWGAEIYEYAAVLLQNGEKKKGLEVLEKLVATSPYHYRAHMVLAENTNNSKVVVNSSKIILKGAEDPKLVAKAAKLLGTKVMTFDSIPYLTKGERGLQLVLIPLNPCDVTLLEEVSKTYQKITGIPVKIRRIKESWDLAAPTVYPTSALSRNPSSN
jgi:hypothetical protein